MISNIYIVSIVIQHILITDSDSFQYHGRAIEYIHPNMNLLLSYGDRKSICV